MNAELGGRFIEATLARNREKYLHVVPIHCVFAQEEVGSIFAYSKSNIAHYCAYLQTARMRFLLI